MRDAHLRALVDLEIQAVERIAASVDASHALHREAGCLDVAHDVARRLAVLLVEPREVGLEAVDAGEVEDHVRLGLDRRVAEAAHRLGAGERVGRQVLDHHQVGLAAQPLGAADAVERLGHARPERLGGLARREREAVHSPGQQVAADEHALAQPGQHLRAARAEPVARDLDHLRRDRGDRRVAPEHQRIALRHVVRRVLLQAAQVGAREEDALALGQAVPGVARQVVDPIGEGEAEPARCVALAVPAARRLELVGELPERAARARRAGGHPVLIGRNPAGPAAESGRLARVS